MGDLEGHSTLGIYTLQPVTGGQTTYANGRIAAPCFSIAYRADRAYRSLSSERIPIASIVSSTPQFRLYIKLTQLSHRTISTFAPNYLALVSDEIRAYG